MRSPPTTMREIQRAQGFAPERIVVAPSGQLAAARWHHQPVEAELIEPNENVLVYHLSGSCDVLRREGGRVTGHGSRHRALTLIRAGSRTQWSIRGASEVVHVYFPDLLLQQYADEHVPTLGNVDLPAFFDVLDPFLEGLYRMIVAEAEEIRVRGATTETLLLDEIQTVLARRLLNRFCSARLHDRSSGNVRSVRGGLSPTALRRVVDRIEEAPQIPAGLAELAAIASLSQDHFIRAFRQSTGKTPYRFVLERRVLAANRLMRSEPSLSLAQIAQRVGFASLAHFSATYRRMTGLAPSSYRSLLD